MIKKVITIMLLMIGSFSVNAQGGYSPTGNNITHNRTEWYRPLSPTNNANNRFVVGWLNSVNMSWQMDHDTIRFTKLGQVGGDKMVMAKPNGDLYSQSFDWSTLGSKPTLFDGQYSSLIGSPTIPAAQVQTDWNAVSGMGQILNKPTLFNGDYNSLSNKPTIPTNTNQLTNGSGFINNLSSFSTTNLTEGTNLYYTTARFNIALSGKNTNDLAEGTNLYFTTARARTAITASGVISYNSSTGVISSSIKKQETYTGTTNSSGVYTITYPVAYSVAPNVQFQVVGGTNKTTILITSSTTTGCSFKVEVRADVLGLLPSYSNVNGGTVDVLVTEK